MGGLESPRDCGGFFLDGDVEIEPAADDMRALTQKGIDGPVRFIRSVNSAATSFGRRERHIHARRAKVFLLYVVLQGKMRVACRGEPYVVMPQHCAIINADEPFCLRTTVGVQGTFECVLAMIPSETVFSRMSWAMSLETSFEIVEAHKRVVSELIDLLCREGHRIGSRMAEPLSEAFLQSISDSALVSFASARQAPSESEVRFANIAECVQKYLTTSGLTADRVAELCAISPRCLYYVLKKNGTTFSDLLWRLRLSKARDWLVADTFKRYPIRKIAEMSGFKSSAHFSRLFSKLYGIPPRKYRAQENQQ
jgi:AraC-like DNA-binding protein/mannose-6-phosphate isomerase-like protein (cupin superfamily)